MTERKIQASNIDVLCISAKTGEGIPALAQWIMDRVNDWNK